MTEAQTLDAVRAAAQPIEAIGALFMLHPETFAGSAANGYQNPFAGYFAGRGGVLGAADADTINAVFGVFEPNTAAALWAEGVAVHGAAGGAARYAEQAADFGRKHLAGAESLDRIAELGERVIAAAPTQGLPLFAGWKRMPLPEDAPGRAMHVLVVLRELRGSVHMAALAMSGLSPVEAHMLNKGEQYCEMFGWPKPYPDAEAKRADKVAAEDATDRRMTQIVGAALSGEEAAELARLSAAALQVANASAS